MKISDITNEDVSAGATGAGAVSAISMPIGTISARTSNRPVTRGRSKKKKPIDEVNKQVPMIYRNWTMDKLQDEMIKARQQGRLSWEGMQAEINRRIESGRVGRAGAAV